LSKFLLKCITCGKEFSEEEVEYYCPVCGERRGTLEVVYDFDQVREKYESSSVDLNNRGIWAFDFLLPFENCTDTPRLFVGNTPLYRNHFLEEKCRVSELLLKDDGRNPTASFKDRASAVAVLKAKEKSFDTVFCASTGNAASSLSGFAAVSGLKSVIFVPATAPAAKITQLQVYGSKILAINASYDRVFDLSMEIGMSKGWYCRNSAINPYLLEGKKTCAMEIALKTKDKLPDFVFVSAGDGTVLSSFYKGFEDLMKLGVISKIPTIVGVQAEGSNAIMRAYERGYPFEPVDIEARTVADSISVGKPRDVFKACRYTQKHNGLFLSVSDHEILGSIIELARETGVFAEPAGATAFAGFKKARRLSIVNERSSVVIVVTGNGLKDLKSVSYVLPKVETLPPVKDAIEEALNEDQLHTQQ